MKIRYIAVVYTLLMLIVLGIFAKEMNETDYKTVDMISINESVKLIEDDIKQGEERYSIEEKRNCEILFFTDKDYESRLNQAALSVTSQAVGSYPAIPPSPAAKRQAVSFLLH